jgi:hypothetical protein
MLLANMIYPHCFMPYPLLIGGTNEQQMSNTQRKGKMHKEKTHNNNDDPSYSMSI